MKNILTYRGGRPYLALGTVENALRVAEMLINKGRPLSAISQSNRTLINQAVQIRNAIAHDSDRAKKDFLRKVPGVAALPNSKRTPGAFLRHEFRVQPNQRRYEVYFSAYHVAANEIRNAW